MDASMFAPRQDLRGFRPSLVPSSRSFRGCLRARVLRRRSCSSTGPGMAPGAGTSSFSTISPPMASRRTRSVFARMAQAKGELSCIAAAFATMSRTLRRWRLPCPSAPFSSATRWAALSSRSSLRRHSSPAAFLLASIPPSGARSMYARLMRNQPLDVLRANATFSLLPFISDPDRARRLLFSAAMSRDDAVRYHRLLQDESMLGALDCLALERVAVSKVRSPVHVMGAADDAIVADHEIKATARAYGTEAVVFDNVAHDMMLDPNWRIVADSMIEKLDAQFGEAVQRVAQVGRSPSRLTPRQSELRPEKSRRPSDTLRIHRAGRNARNRAPRRARRLV